MNLVSPLVLGLLLGPQTDPECAAVGHGSGAGAAGDAALSVSVAHGDLGESIHLAHAFLAGCDEGGKPTNRANHAPASWRRRHLHRGLYTSAPYFMDEDVPGGHDRDPTHGIEGSTLLFYAGHGRPYRWETLAPHTLEFRTRVAAGDGGLRYFWLCSCNVMAHGAPDDPQLRDPDYSDPTSFRYDLANQGADQQGMRNVFWRWRTVFAPGLRLVCGGATQICGGGAEVANRIWDNYGYKRMGVDDAFLDGLVGGPRSMPLCLTRGGPDIEQTPLYTDGRFNEEPFPQRPDDSFYIEYPVPAAAPTPAPPAQQPPGGLRLPAWEVDGARALEGLDLEGFVEDGPLLVTSDGRARVDRRTGAWSYRGVAGPPRSLGTSEGPRTEAQILSLVTQALSGTALPGSPLAGELLGWAARSFRGDRSRIAETFTFRIDRTGVQALGRRIDSFERTVTARFRRSIAIPESPLAAGITSVPVLGPGGLVSVQADLRPEVVHASVVWRRLREHGETVWRAVRPWDEAARNAWLALERADGYRLEDWRWGYREEAGNCVQRHLRIVYQFDFVAAGGQSSSEFPPRRIEVPGQIDEYPPDPCAEGD